MADRRVKVGNANAMFWRSDPLMTNTGRIPPMNSSSAFARLCCAWHHYRSRHILRQKEIARQQPHARFDQLMATAREIAGKNPRALVDLLKAVLLPLQAEYLLGVAERGQGPYPSIDLYRFFGPAVYAALFASDGTGMRGKRLDPKGFRLDLSRHMVLPWAWSHERYVRALTTIGSSKQNNARAAWQQDDNHFVTLWLPWGIGFVGNGNHSITAGILAGEGSLQPTQVYDMSYVFDEIRCDGRYYLGARSGKLLCPVLDVRRAAAFEIGRLMLDANCPAFPQKPGKCLLTERRD
ncbi:DUF6710 family protein [Ralstonia sp. 25C]|uniref:DUF6710 family protein n=1 Tax=Ralstonia sp. 25C TaxID=3447363 RepID=UPI003F750BAB